MMLVLTCPHQAACADSSKIKEQIVMGLFDIFGKKEPSFMMTIMDVFLINNHGTVVTGVIQKGVIQVNDTVKVAGKKYKVFMIDAVVTPGSKAPSPVNIASEGTNVALHLSTMDHSRFVRGNTVIK